MIFSTNYWSKPTDDVPGGRKTHTESPWTLNIHRYYLPQSVDPILGSKNRIITILEVYETECHREIAHLGTEIIGL